MADEKEPMQADGQDGSGWPIAEDEDPPSAGRPDMQDNSGQSGGGSYPSRYDDPENADTENTFMGHGGQKDIRYYGDGEPRSEDSVAEEHNAVTEDED